MMMTAMEFVGMVARLTKDGELVDYDGGDGDQQPFVMENDDAVTTLNQLITQARGITH